MTNDVQQVIKFVRRGRVIGWGHPTGQYVDAACVLADELDRLTKASPPAPSGWQQRLWALRKNASTPALTEIEEAEHRGWTDAINAVCELFAVEPAKDPIADAVHAELAPLADALIEAGHKLVKGHEVTVRLMDTDDDPMLVHGDYPECRIAAPHRGSSCGVWGPVSKESR